MPQPLFSVCVPNFNYERYIGETIASVLAQDYDDFEIVVSDNASTDRSVEIVQSFADPRIHLRVNQYNIGFAGNLDRAGAMAHGKHMIMLSSDDIMLPNALSTYARLLRGLEPEAREKTVITSPPVWIDGDSKVLGGNGPDMKFWSLGQPNAVLTDATRAEVITLDAPQLLARALSLLRSPLPFAPTCYPRSLYQAVEGYSGGRLINPDKWFGWKLLSVANWAVMVNAPLFQYRWHATNQSAQQAKAGSIKHLIDQYVNTIELPADVLTQAGVTRQHLVEAFVEQDVALRNLERVAEGQRLLARRGLHFGFAAYPAECRRNWKVWALEGFLALGPVGTLIARLAKDRAHRRWAQAQGAETLQELRSR
jgi:glycosyltransferase involved in cell wall biosynthesis